MSERDAARVDREKSERWREKVTGGGRWGAAEGRPASGGRVIEEGSLSCCEYGCMFRGISNWIHNA